MHKLKNKKLLSIFMAGIISYACISIDNIYANENSDIIEIDSSSEDTNNEDTNNNVDEEDNNIDIEDSNNDTDIDDSENEDKDDDNLQLELKNISVNEINNIDNIGLNIKTQGSINKIQDNKIYIKDESGEGIIYLDGISVNNLNIGECISIIGIVNQKDNENVVIVNDVNNIKLVIIEENPIEDTNKDNSNKSENSKPNQSNKTQSTSKSNSKENTSKLDVEEVTVNSIKGKDAIVIEDDLTSAQWEKVKLHLEQNNIKVKDLKNNKIRITQVNNESGDNIWIVNDPRMLDSEDTKTIGSEIIDTLLYSEYDVTESKWNTIVEDVECGIAKVKYDSDKNIKVIYQNSNGKDSIITLNRTELE